MNSNIVVAHYKARSYFKIPEDIDLNDKNVVESYDVKDDVLIIYKKNGENIWIEPFHFECDKKQPKKTDTK